VRKLIPASMDRLLPFLSLLSLSGKPLLSGFFGRRIYAMLDRAAVFAGHL
jgi:hypothetical protein